MQSCLAKQQCTRHRQPRSKVDLKGVEQNHQYETDLQRIFSLGRFSPFRVPFSSSQGYPQAQSLVLKHIKWQLTCISKIGPGPGIAHVLLCLVGHLPAHIAQQLAEGQALFREGNQQLSQAMALVPAQSLLSASTSGSTFGMPAPSQARPLAPCLYQSHPASITALFISPPACEQPAGKSLWAKSYTDKLKSFKSFTNYMASRHPKHS